MKHIKEHFIQTHQSQRELLGLIAIENSYAYSPLTEGLDLLLLAIVEQTAVQSIEHVRIEGQHVLIRSASVGQLEQWMASGENKSIIQWIVRGEILLERDSRISDIRERIIQFPDVMREQKRFVEFSGFLRSYLQAKHDYEERNILDAYSNILTALHHWAHIVLIEEGQHPELTVWRQMRRVHPGVYKLYEELTVSPETLEQRVQLVMLACEFTVINKMKDCCSLLFNIMMSREEPWSISELQEHERIKTLHVDLSLLLQRLVKRSLIREVAVMAASGDTEALELRYMTLAV